MNATKGGEAGTDGGPGPLRAGPGNTGIPTQGRLVLLLWLMGISNLVMVLVAIGLFLTVHQATAVLTTGPPDQGPGEVSPETVATTARSGAQEFSSPLKPDEYCHLVHFWTPPTDAGGAETSEDSSVGLSPEQRAARTLARQRLHDTLLRLAGGWSRVEVTGEWVYPYGHGARKPEVMAENGYHYWVGITDCNRDLHALAQSIGSIITSPDTGARPGREGFGQTGIFVNAWSVSPREPSYQSFTFMKEQVPAKDQ